jgi:hypothetical protein
MKPIAIITCGLSAVIAVTILFFSAGPSTDPVDLYNEYERAAKDFIAVEDRAKKETDPRVAINLFNEAHAFAGTLEDLHRRISRLAAKDREELEEKIKPWKTRIFPPTEPLAIE